jgi:hypothetical protein
MWLSEGFISLEEGPAGEYYIGPSYYIGVYILRRNLIEPNQYKGRGYSIMHDVIRSFGQYMAKEESLVIRSGGHHDVPAAVFTDKVPDGLCQLRSLETLIVHTAQTMHHACGT